jgi:hypothetical protein
VPKWLIRLTPSQFLKKMFAFYSDFKMSHHWFHNTSKISVLLNRSHNKTTVKALLDRPHFCWNEANRIFWKDKVIKPVQMRLNKKWKNLNDFFISDFHFNWFEIGHLIQQQQQQQQQQLDKNHSWNIVIIWKIHQRLKKTNWFQALGFHVNNPIN